MSRFRHIYRCKNVNRLPLIRRVMQTAMFHKCRAALSLNILDHYGMIDLQVNCVGNIADKLLGFRDVEESIEQLKTIFGVPHARQGKDSIPIAIVGHSHIPPLHCALHAFSNMQAAKEAHQEIIKLRDDYDSETDSDFKKRWGREIIKTNVPIINTKDINWMQLKTGGMSDSAK